MHIAKFTKENLLCSHCDSWDHPVKWDDPSTGVIFSKFGHVWNGTTKTMEADYVQIVFAYCPACIVICGLQPMIDASLRLEEENNAVFISGGVDVSRG